MGSERRDTTAVIHPDGDVDLAVAPSVFGELRAAARRAEVDRVVVELPATAALGLAGVATLAVGSRLVTVRGKQLSIIATDRQRAALALAEVRAATAVEAPPEQPARAMERVGDRVLASTSSTRALIRLVGRAAQQALAVAFHRRRIPEGSIAVQLELMGVDAIPIIGLLMFLLGMTTAFQGAIQLQRFGATPFVADLIGLSMVRELAPLMTAIILTGRTGAAIAAELGTMRVRSELDALSAMGIDPVRFLVVPRIAALTIVQPALTLIATFIGIAGGMLVGTLVLDLNVIAFWNRIGATVVGSDFGQSIAKSVVFAWIIGLTGCHLGMRTTADAGGVGRATTRTVVASIFAIIVVDATFATLTSRRFM
jgi:phospholipid/cholesterol/gamma-HCH transport system permease protein